ncbi:MAG: hypothetical protein ABIS59_03455 [Candidatus Saccharibacteria bacterium]
MHKAQRKSRVQAAERRKATMARIITCAEKAVIPYGQVPTIESIAASAETTTKLVASLYGGRSPLFTEILRPRLILALEQAQGEDNGLELIMAFNDFAMEYFPFFHILREEAREGLVELFIDFFDTPTPVYHEALRRAAIGILSPGWRIDTSTSLFFLKALTERNSYPIV